MNIKGYASTNDLDRARHVVAANAFRASIAAKGLSGPKGIRLLHQHRSELVIGRILKLEQRAKGLWIEAEVDEDIAHGREVAAMIRAAGGLSYSVGFFVRDADIEEDASGGNTC
ncbi:HK97 family phage prohead protease [Rhodobacteraceae bacterium DSL-40]|uniref:HK97 family phage prohead protease n=1 Tax=Amaricoccus sp. B4 TaxID=3368557 RepID=UPI0013A6F9AD